MIIIIYICTFYFNSYNVIKGDKPFYPIGKLLARYETFHTSKILIMTKMILVM